MVGLTDVFDSDEITMFACFMMSGAMCLTMVFSLYKAIFSGWLWLGALVGSGILAIVLAGYALMLAMQNKTKGGLDVMEGMFNTVSDDDDGLQ